MKPGSDPVLEADFVRNLHAISAINRERGVKTIWVGQVLNLARLTGGGRYGWLPYVRDKDVWPLQARFDEILHRVRQRPWVIPASTCRSPISAPVTSSTRVTSPPPGRKNSLPALHRSRGETVADGRVLRSFGFARRAPVKDWLKWLARCMVPYDK